MTLKSADLTETALPLARVASAENPPSRRSWRLASLVRRAELSLRVRSGSDARLEAELLLSHSLELTRTQLYAQMTKPATEEEQARFETFLQRRLAGEP